MSRPSDKYRAQRDSELQDIETLTAMLMAEDPEMAYRLGEMAYNNDTTYSDSGRSQEDEMLELLGARREDRQGNPHQGSHEPSRASGKQGRGNRGGYSAHSGQSPVYDPDPWDEDAPVKTNYEHNQYKAPVAPEEKPNQGGFFGKGKKNKNRQSGEPQNQAPRKPQGDVVDVPSTAIVPTTSSTKQPGQDQRGRGKNLALNIGEIDWLGKETSFPIFFGTLVAAVIGQVTGVAAIVTIIKVITVLLGVLNLLRFMRAYRKFAKLNDVYMENDIISLVRTYRSIALSASVCLLAVAFAVVLPDGAKFLANILR